MRITKSLQKWTISLALIMAIGIMDAFRYSSISPNSKILHINLEQIAKSSVSIKLSEIASEISYVPLETTKDCFFTPSQYLVRGNYIYAKDRDNGKVLLFNGEGKFIRQIGNIGKGPLEHMGAFNIHATPTGDRVYLYSKSSNRLSEYSFEGKKISDCSAKYASWWFAPLGNDQNIFLAPFGYPVPDSSAFFYYLQDNKGKVTKKYKSSTNIPIGGVIEFGNFYVNPRSILTFQPLCDTVFAISDKGDFTPEYVFDFGNGRMPDEVWRETPKYEKVKYDYINYINLVETKNTLFVRFIYQKSNRIGLISLKNGEMQGYKTDKGLIENDLDGGPDVWPKETDGLNVVYSFIQPVDLVQQWQSGALKNKKFRSQADHDQFVKMVMNLKVDDNPVVMVVRLK